jgi:hypothetical protein
VIKRVKLYQEHSYRRKKFTQTSEENAETLRRHYHKKMADLVAQALTQHDKVRRSTDIPLFYGKKDKDTISPQQLIERIERAARVANWNTDERKCDEFFLCLRDKAISWHNTLDNVDDFNKTNWTDVKKEFLDAYAPKFTARTLCTSFQDLRQKTEESVQDFYNRVSDVFRDAYQTKPDHVVNYGGDLLGLTIAQCVGIRKTGIDSMQKLMMNTVFLGGLKEEIRVKVLESGSTRVQESVRLAREIEVIVQDKRIKGTQISSIQEDEENPDADHGNEEEDELLERVNAIRSRSGRAPFRLSKPRAGPSRGAGASNKQNNVKCRFCKFSGHFQAECRKRIAKGAPMVDAQGQPYKVGSVQPGQGSVSSMQGSSYYEPQTGGSLNC